MSCPFFVLSGPSDGVWTKLGLYTLKSFPLQKLISDFTQSALCGYRIQKYSFLELASMCHN
jgi:hypothetical protein